MEAITKQQCETIGGLFSEGQCVAVPSKELEQSVDILTKLKETNQIYIVGHDVPLSISQPLFNMLEARRKTEARRRKLPDEQFDLEDIVGHFVIGSTFV